MAKPNRAGADDTRWQRVEIAGRPADLFEPDALEQPSRRRRVPARLRRADVRESEVFTAELTRADCGRSARSRIAAWWTTVPCPDFDPAVSPLEFVRGRSCHSSGAVASRAARRSDSLGIGMGGKECCNWPIVGREFPVVAAIAPAVDFHTWHGYGSAWTGCTPRRRPPGRRRPRCMSIRSIGPSTSSLLRSGG